jgi:hypothetical protein
VRKTIEAHASPPYDLEPAGGCCAASIADRIRESLYLYNTG